MPFSMFRSHTRHTATQATGLGRGNMFPLVWAHAHWAGRHHSDSLMAQFGNTVHTWQHAAAPGGLTEQRAELRWSKWSTEAQA